MLFMDMWYILENFASKLSIMQITLCIYIKRHFYNSAELHFVFNILATCKKNEIYDICPAPCPPKRCDVDESIIKCKAPPQPGDPDCNPGCRCIDNYYKNDKNMCVPKNECRKFILIRYDLK